MSIKYHFKVRMFNDSAFALLYLIEVNGASHSWVLYGRTTKDKLKQLKKMAKAGGFGWLVEHENGKCPKVKASKNFEKEWI